MMPVTPYAAYQGVMQIWRNKLHMMLHGRPRKLPDQQKNDEYLHISLVLGTLSASGLT